MSISSPGLSGPQQLAAISTSLAALQREHYGRYSTKVKAYAIEDMIVVVMRPTSSTPLEKTLADGGRADSVLAMRQEFDRGMAGRYTRTIRDATGHDVVALLSQSHVDPDITVETFFLDRRFSPGIAEGLAEVIPIADAIGTSSDVPHERT
jgi:uncharacterized protein YbcI